MASIARHRRIAMLAAAATLATLIAMVAVQMGHLRITRRPTVDLNVLIAMLNVAIYVWIRTGVSASFRRQALLLATMVFVQVGLRMTVRVDGFTGDGRPIWKWRWERTRGEVLQADRAARATSRRSADLARTTTSDAASFRGADRRGVMRTAQRIADWQSHPPKLLWRRPIGAAWSSFAVVGNCGVTQEQHGADEAVAC